MKRKAYFQQLGQFKKEIAKPFMDRNELNISEDFQPLLTTLLPVLKASGRSSSLDKDNLWYDIASHPTVYLGAMYTLSQIMERHLVATESKTKQKKGVWFAAFPTRTSHIPCYLTLEHKILLVTVMEQPYQRFDNDEQKQEWWSSLFRTDKRPFHSQQNHHGENAYTFEGTLYTDGIGVSIVKQRVKRKSRAKGTKNKTAEERQQRLQLAEELKQEKAQHLKLEREALKRKQHQEDQEDKRNGLPKKRRLTAKQQQQKEEIDINWPHITDWSPDQLKESQGRCVLIDPNRRDLLYAMHEDSTPTKPNILKYTWNRQVKEMDTRGHRRLRLRLDNQLYTMQPTLKAALDIHATTQSSKSTNLSTYIAFLQSRSTLTHIHHLDTHYEQLIFVSFEHVKRLVDGH